MINLYHLKYFLDAARLGNLAKAARENRVSSPAISQAIKKLEEHFGEALLEHQKNRFELTDAGRSLLNSGSDLLCSVEDFEKKVAMGGVENRGPLLLGTQQSIAQSLLPEFFSDFTGRYEGILPRMRLGTTATVKNWLMNGEIEIALSLDNLPLPGCEKWTVHKGRFLLIAARDTKYQLEDGPFLMTSETNETEVFIAQYHDMFGKYPHTRMVVNSWGVIERHVLAGLGIGLVPDYKIEDSDDLRVFRKLPAEDIPYEICVYKRRGEVLSNPAQVFLDEIRRLN